MYAIIFLVLYVIFQVWTFYRLEIFWNEKRRWRKNDRDKFG